MVWKYNMLSRGAKRTLRATMPEKYTTGSSSSFFRHGRGTLSIVCSSGCMENTFPHLRTKLPAPFFRLRLNSPQDHDSAEDLARTLLEMTLSNCFSTTHLCVKSVTPLGNQCNAMVPNSRSKPRQATTQLARALSLRVFGHGMGGSGK